VVIAVISGNDPCAFVGAMNIVHAAVEDWKAGKKYNGRSYMRFDARSKRLQFLHFEESTGASNLKASRIEKRQNDESSDENARKRRPRRSGGLSTRIRRRRRARRAKMTRMLPRTNLLRRVRRARRTRVHRTRTKAKCRTRKRTKRRSCGWSSGRP
jgi:hypothetical protein